jgi:HK97 family phage portal protein
MFQFFRAAFASIFSVLTSNVREPAGWLVEWLRGNDPTGGPMKAEDALKLPEVWYAVTKIAGHVATLPMHQYEIDAVDERVKTKLRSHPAWRAVHTRPNPLYCAAVFWETLMVHALLRGNGRAAIDRDSQGRARRLNLLPTNTKTVIVNGEKWHVADILNEDRTSTTRVPYPDRDVLHIIGLSFDGITGIDLMQFASDSMRTGRAAIQSTRNAFENWGVPGMLVTAPRGMFKTDDEARDWLNEFREAHKGAKNRGKSAMIKEGMTATVLQQNLKDFEASEIRKLTRQDAALWFLIEQIVGDDTSVSYNSLEQKNLAYLANCLMRWLRRIEQESDEKLFSQKEKSTNRFFNKFNVAALLRADVKTQAEAIAKLIGVRVYNPNTARELLDLNPYDGGDEYANPAITPGTPGEKSDPSN